MTERRDARCARCARVRAGERAWAYDPGMARKSWKARRLVVGDDTYLWSLRHRHRREDGRARDCRETVRLRRSGTRGCLVITFRDGGGGPVPDGFVGSGEAAAVSGGYVNLNEPGSVRALLDEAVAGGWRPDDPRTVELDGWLLFPAVSARRAASRSEGPEAARH